MSPERPRALSDLLAAFAGEALDVRVPMVGGNTSNRKFKCTAPCFCTGRAPITAVGHEGLERVQHQGMMDERFTIFSFHQPLPQGNRRVDFPQRGGCCAQFLLSGNEVAAQRRAQMAAQQAPLPVPRQLPAEGALAPAAVAGALGGSFLSELRELAGLRREGLLSEAEFELAKQRLL